MSQENVEAVREWVAAVNAGDAPRLTALADPDVDYMPYLAALSGAAGAYHGHDGLRQYLDDLSEAWSEYEVEIYELQDLGNQVLMKGRLRGKGRSSGLDIDAEMTWLYTRLLFFTDEAEALEAAGLSE